MEHRPIHQKVASSIPGQSTYLGRGLDPQSGYVWEATNQCFSLTSMFFSFALPSFLSKINKKQLKYSQMWIFKKMYIVECRWWVFSRSFLQLSCMLEKCLHNMGENSSNSISQIHAHFIYKLNLDKKRESMSREMWPIERALP